MGIFIFAAATFLPAIFILGSAVLLFWPTLQALIASTPALLLAAVLYVLSWHLNKSVR